MLYLFLDDFRVIPVYHIDCYNNHHPCITLVNLRMFFLITKKPNSNNWRATKTLDASFHVPMDLLYVIPNISC